MGTCQELTIIKCELKIVKCELKMAECELKIVKCELKMVKCEFKMAQCTLKMVKCEFKMGNCELKMVKSKLTETSLKTEAGRDRSEVRPHPVTTALLGAFLHRCLSSRKTREIRNGFLSRKTREILNGFLHFSKFLHLPANEEDEEGRQTGREVAE